MKSACAIFLKLLLSLVVLPVLSAAQTFTVLHTFQGADGGGPEGSLTLDTVGNIYGTTVFGGTGTNCPYFGTAGCGTVFMLNEAGKEVALYSFDGPNGAGPSAGVLRDPMGNLFGTTQEGGVLLPCGGAHGTGCGVAFRLDKKGKEVRYKFRNNPDGSSGSNPISLLVEDAAGNLYGTTKGGGADGAGTVFKIDATGKESALYSFTGGVDGCDPSAGVILDSSGNLYGVTVQGGSGFCNSGYGVVFKLDPSGSLAVLHTFGVGDGAYPHSALLFDSQGNLYGATTGGGSGAACASFDGCGTVFELLGNGSWMEKVLYSFCALPNCVDGLEPSGPLARDASGNLYGTTIFGGASQSCNGNNCGTVFKLDPAGNETVLHSFTGGSDGETPSGIVIDSAANLYGSTQDGGATCFTSLTCGVVFKITP